MNFSAFDLNLLRVFDALMVERGVTRAGSRIGLSQPAVSSALNRLRAILDDQLFVRSGTQMVPTPRAEDIAPAVAEALARVEAALFGDVRFDPATLERTFTLQGADFFSVLLMPALSRRLATAAPGVRLRMLDTARGDIERLLRDDVIDLSLEPSISMPEWVASDHALMSPFLVIAARGHPALATVPPGDRFPLDLYCALPHAIRSVDGTMSGVIDEGLERIDRSRRVVLALPNFQGVATTVAEGELIAAIPEQFARAYADRLGLALYALPMPTAVPEIRMYWRRRNSGNPVHAWLRSMVREACADLRPL